MKKALLAVTLLLFWASSAVAQSGGISTFTAADNFTNDTINLTTLTPVVHFGLLAKGTGSSISVESPQSCHVVSLNTYCGYQTNLLPGFFFVPSEFGALQAVGTISLGSCNNLTVTGFMGWDGLTIHPISQVVVYQNSGCGVTSATATTIDGSGITATFGYPAVVGTDYVSSSQNASGWTWTNSTGKIADPFGNTMTWGTPGGSFTDLLGAVTTLGNGAQGFGSPSSYGYTDAGGNSRTISLVAGTATTFQPFSGTGCGTNNAGTSVTPVSSITFPDSTSISLTWDTNNSGIDGMIKSFTTREGGTITYTYGTVTCNGWYFNTLSRQTPDGTTSYSASYASNITTTTVLDPGKNKTVYTFFTFGSPAAPSQTSTIDRYQNTGTVASPTYTHISETQYCYNTHSCSTAPTYPITQLDTYEYTYTPTPTQVQMSHDVKTYDSTYGLLLTDAATDSITSQTITTTYVYGSDSSGTCVAITNTAVVDHPCTITTKNGTTWLSGSTYTYNANGALTSSSACLSSTCTGSSALTTTYTPNTTGTYSAIQDPNGQTVNYTYGSCNSLMPTDITTTVNSIAIDHKATWNCNGGLVTDTTDPNSNEDDYTYDSMNRISTYHDRMGDTNTTSYAYGTPTLDHVKVTDNIGVVSYQYNDGLGRPTNAQVCETSGCTTLDTSSTSYAWNGVNFEIKTYVPCTQTTLNTACTTVAVTADVNPMGPFTTTDANSGTGTVAINSKDWSFTAGPHPSQENNKIVQTEVDGFGRVTSTCALESSGGTSCGQTMGNSGILTSNVYSFATGAPKVVTTRGSQSHTAIADALGRPTSLTLPETGATARTWSYDSQSSMDACTASSRTSYGDLLRDNLPDGTNYVCYIYDGLHRLSQVGNSGSSHTINPCKRFKYDSTANKNYTAPSDYPASGNNLIGRLMEASTDNCGATELTDEWFAYDKDGRLTDMWESTPNSSGFYHTTVTYDADGVVTGLSGIPSSNSYTWGLDGEDRPNSFSHNSTTVVSATAGSGFKYDAASRPTNVPMGTNGDQDTFTFDNVGNMTDFKFSVNSTTDEGALTWNSIGSLNKLVITDGFNSGGTQTCTYGTSTVEGYDDVGRLLDANCGSSIQHDSWTYDQYDNATRTGNPGTSWNPGYSSTTNQYTLTGATYDSNGNNTYDGVNTYSFNLYGKMSGTISGNHTITCGSTGVQCATYDALGRLVEASSGSAQQQILLSPIGRVAYMSGQTVGALYVDMPWAGAYLGTASDYYLHPDWLGTKRLTTSVSGRTATYDVAYTPYGETYDSFGTSDWKYLDFTGDKQAIVSGLWDTDNRELFVNSSRWLSPDTAHSGWNAYAYVTDPNTQTDPSGLDPEDPAKKVGVIPFLDCRPDNPCKTKELPPAPPDPSQLDKDVAGNASLQLHEGLGIVGREPGISGPHTSGGWFGWVRDWWRDEVERPDALGPDPRITSVWNNPIAKATLELPGPMALEGGATSEQVRRTIEFYDQLAIAGRSTTLRGEFADKAFRFLHFTDELLAMARGERGAEMVTKAVEIAHNMTMGESGLANQIGMDMQSSIAKAGMAGYFTKLGSAYEVLTDAASMSNYRKFGFWLLRRAGFNDPLIIWKQ